MTRQSQPAIVLPAHPLWVRLAAVVSLLLMLVASSAQAHHVHGEWLPHASAKAVLHADFASRPRGEATCPLCMAMHSAMPSGIGDDARTLAWLDDRVALVQDRIAFRVLPFSQFSRPPPAFSRG